MDKKMKFKYFYGTEADQFSFYRIPKALFTDSYFKDLSSDAKILYGLMLDRMSLSIKNQWFDEKNRAYIYFSIEDIMELLNCGRNKAIKSMQELDDETGIGLIEKRRQGFGKVNIIYVKTFMLEKTEEKSLEDELKKFKKQTSEENEESTEVYNSNFMKSQNQTSRSPENKLQEVYISNPNYTNLSDTEMNYNKSNQIVSADENRSDGDNPTEEYQAYENLVKETVDYESLEVTHHDDMRQVDEIVNLIVETVMCKNDKILIASNWYPTALVKKKFLMLTYSHIEYVLHCMSGNTSKVKNIKKYLLAALFNAPSTMNGYYQAEVNHDMNLFNEAEAASDGEPDPEKEIEVTSHKRKKHAGKKEEDLSHFEVTERIEYKLTGQERYCPDCGKKYKVVTKETVKRLKFVPARFEVVEEISYVYSCPECGAMKRLEKVPALIKGSIATPSLVAGIMNAKYVNGMPLARQEREFARYNLKLSTKTMANWMVSCADRYLRLLYDRMKEEFLKSRYIHCDETRVQVIDEPKQQGSTQNWMWVYLTDRYSEAPQMVLFDYERTRAGYHPKNFLGDQFEGYLTCDGYQAYHGLKDSIVVSGCFTHARRRFDAALTALKKDFTKEQLRGTVAYQAMSRIGILYKIEELIQDKTPEERYLERQKQSRPVVDAFFEWLHSMEDSVDRSSLIGDAILYALNQETYLRRYLEDGHLSIDNNSAERAIKNFAVGRRNWLFSKSIRGADASATIYSITETALLNGLKPYLYLTYVLDQLRRMGSFPEEEKLDQLLPWSKELPEELRTTE